MVLYMIGLLVIGKALEDSGITQIFADWIVSRKSAQGRPWVLSTLILVTAYACSMFIVPIAPAIICWNIIYGICDKVGYKKGDKWPTFMVVTTMIMATVGGLMFPFTLGIAANFAILTQVSGGTLTYSFVAYFALAMVVCNVTFVLTILAGKYLVKPDVSLLMQTDEDVVETKMVFTKHQKSVMIIFVVFFIGLFLPSFLPADSALGQLFNALGGTGWTAAVLAIGEIIKVEDKKILDFNALSKTAILWDIIFMLAAIFTMSAALTAESTGFSGFILTALTPILQNVTPLMFIALVVIITLILANLINNVAVCAILIPLVYILSSGIEVNLIATVALLIIIGNIGFLLPSSSPQSALVYNQDWADKKLIKPYSILEMLIALVVCLASIPLAVAIM